jgi:GTP cyclohydrolase II
MGLSPLKIKELLDENRYHQCDGFGSEHVCVKIAAIADLPSRFGQFQVVAFWNNRDGKEHAALIHGDICDCETEDVPMRLHSECLTGDAFGSLRCDCRDQLETAMKAIAQYDRGVLLYMRQEGRGIGFLNKIRAYGLQDYGYDTVDANLALGFHDDEREYSVAAHMLESLRVRSVRLMTNNPKKIKELSGYGIKVTERIPLVIQPNEYNRHYLETKQEKSGHMLGLQHQMDPIFIEGMPEEEQGELQEG